MFASAPVLMDDHWVQVCVCVHSSQLLVLAAIIGEPNYDGRGYSSVCVCF